MTLKNANGLLVEAAIRGSTEALVMHSKAISGDLRGLQDGRWAEDELREVYSIANNKQDVSRALEKLSAAQLVVGLVRGDIFMSSSELDYFQKNDLSEPFAPAEWYEVYAIATSYYRSLEDNRIQLGLGPFDNNYPPEYADLFGLPETNSTLNALDEFIANFPK